jgi:tetraacyldisaccharide 4'-kinase
VGIVSRGYGAEAGSRNDEALELELDLPDVPHLQNVDRAAAAQVAIEELGMEVVVLDDGFQHRRLARELDVVLLDASAPFGYGHQLPRGLLRESPRGLQRAGAVVLTRADMLDATQRAALAEHVRRLAPQAVWAETTHRPVALVDAGGLASDLAALRGARIAAFCGLGNPSGFRHTLAQAGADVALWREFPDHHHYTREDVEALTEAIAAARVELAVCTRKDLVKLQIARLGGTRLRAVAIELEFQCGQEAVEQRIRQALPPASDATEPLTAADTPESY